MAGRKKIAFYTLGCKLNFSESSQISRQFPTESFEIIDYKEEADIYVINTCAVTEKAEKKSRAAVHKFKKRNPNAVVVAVGCYSELKADELKTIDGADMVLGVNGKFLLPQYLINKHSSVSQDDMDGLLNERFIPSYSSNERTRSFFKIQDGCDYFCSYCTVPLIRGRSRSDTIGNTINIVREIAATGVKEMILTGVNVGDFGRKNGENLTALLQKLDTFEGIERIRISSIEPDLLSFDIIGFVAYSKKILPHFHIPLQSGCDKTLKAMKRRYDTALFTEKIRRIKQCMPDCCIATDIIVGFPGETESDFEETYRFIETSAISYMHVFPYSERENTQALALSEKVSNAEKTKRSKRLLALSEIKKNTFYKENAGKEKYVLFESDNDNGVMYGFTENYIKVKTPYHANLINEIKKVRLVEIEKDGIFVVKL